MAIANSKRSAPRFARASGHRRARSERSHSRTKEDGSKAHAPVQRLREIAALGVRLRVIYGTAVTVELALRAQAAEQDAEIADCLREGLCNALCDAMDKVDEITRHFAKGRRGPKT